MKSLTKIALVTGGLLVMGVITAQCPVDWSLTSNHTRLYLFMPTAQDATFPEYDDTFQTSPLEPFDIADLDANIGTTLQLREAIVNVVKEDYCEFDVEVIPTTTLPVTAGAQWQIVGIGSDEEDGGNLFGVAQDVDLNNADAQDYSRVYAGSFAASYGGAGGALNGANSTLQRWATAIGHTASHEAGHNFGLSHGDSSPRTGEDIRNNHIMATGSTGLTGDIRASRDRHFSDRSYEILGHNVGLRIQTLYNWDFVNPNAEDAHSLELTLLSSATTLTIRWSYNGATSPWTNPTIASAGTQAFQGTTYNRFRLTFSTAKAWSGGANGIVPGGEEFHVGAAFSESNAVIVYETRLRDATPANLALHPRMVGFDNGVADMGTGDFNVTAFNPDAADGALEVEDFRVMLLPRMASIESMLSGIDPLDIRGVPVSVRNLRKELPRFPDFKENVKISVATLNDPRFVDEFYDSTNCQRGMKKDAADANVGEIEYCPHGWALSLFPSTYVYIIATVVDPNAKYWDKAQGKYVTGPLKTRVFQQFSGIVPDYNKNGVDDLVDIRTKVSIDKNQNGVIDEVEGDAPAKGESFLLTWWWVIVLILLLVILAYYLRKIKKEKPIK